MPVGEKQTYRFGPFELDTQCGQLRKDGVGLKLQGQPVAILEILLEHPGQLVTREELRERLWSSDTFVDFDHSLNTAIKKLRQALGDEANTPRYIETLPRRGYRFVGMVCAEDNRRNASGIDLEIYGDVVSKATGTSVDVGTEAVQHSKRKAHRSKWIVVLSALLLMATGAAYWLMKPMPQPRITGSHVLTNTRYRKTAYTSGVKTDGSSVYFQEVRPSGVVTLRVPVSGGEVSEVPGIQGQLVDITRDGSQLLFMVGESNPEKIDAWVQPLPAGTPRMIARDAAWPFFTADGRGLIIGRNNFTEFHRVSIDGSDSRKLANVPDITYPQLSPDGSRIRFVVVPSFSMWDIGADGSDPHKIPVDRDNVVGGTWSPDGKFYFFSAWDGERHSLWSFSEERHWWKKWTPIPQRLTVGPAAVGRPTMSKDGKQLYAQGIQHNGELSVYEPKSKKFVPYLGGISVCYVDYSRDGQWIAYVSYPDGTLWRSRLDGSDRMQLTSPPLAVINPRWSPDGRLIAFMDLSNGDRSRMSEATPSRIYLVSTDGGGPVLLLAGGFGDPTWSPDGKNIAYSYRVSSSATASDVRIFDLQAQKSNTITGSEHMWSARWSPDGQYLVALSGEDSPTRLMLFRFSTNSWEELASGRNIGWQCWSRDSKFVYALDGRSVFRVALSNHRKQEVTSIDFRSTAYIMDKWNQGWLGLTPDDGPITTRDTAVEQIYAFDLEYK